MTDKDKRITTEKEAQARLEASYKGGIQRPTKNFLSFVSNGHLAGISTCETIDSSATIWTTGVELFA
jgi:hypothetical protein